MIKPVIIGNKKFKSKKDALAHYKSILNSYSFRQSLNEEHCNDLIDLLNISYSNDDTMDPTEIDVNSSLENNFDEEAENELFVEDVKVSRAQFNTKCFEIFYSDGTSSIISYILYISNP